MPILPIASRNLVYAITSRRTLGGDKSNRRNVQFNVVHKKITYIKIVL